MQRAILRLFALALITSLAGAACTLIAEVDRGDIPSGDSSLVPTENMGGDTSSGGNKGMAGDTGSGGMKDNLGGGGGVIIDDPGGAAGSGS